MADRSSDLLIRTRNSSERKHMARSHEKHYSASVRQLEQDAPRRLEGLRRIALPGPLPIEASLSQAILTRASHRVFAPSPLRLAELATILRLGNGTRPARDDRPYQRNVPNSGNLGSIEVYPIVLSVEGLDEGIYHFDSVAGELVLLQPGAFRGWLRHLVFYQVEFSEPAVALVLTSAFGRLEAKYGERALRLGHLDAGFVAENHILVANALNLAQCPTAGFIDDELNDALRVDGVSTAAVLAVLVGRQPR